MPSEDDTARAERGETRHHVGGDEVGPEAIDDDEQVSTRGRLSGYVDAQAGDQRRQGNESTKGIEHAHHCVPSPDGRCTAQEEGGGQPGDTAHFHGIRRRR